MKILLFLFATAAVAQPFVSPAEITAPLERSTFATRTAPAMSLVRDGNGFVAAWSAGAAPSRIYVARLNAAFKPITPVVKLDAYLGEAYDANYPDIAPIDGGYAVVWLERERISAPRPVNVLLARLSPSLAPQPTTQVAAIAETGLARITGSQAGDVSVLVPQTRYTLAANGSRSFKTFNGSGNFDDVAVGGGTIGVSGRSWLAPPNPCWGGMPPCITGTFYVTASAGDNGYGTFSNRNDFFGSAIGYGGGMFVAVWLDNSSKLVNAARIRTDGTTPSQAFSWPVVIGTFAFVAGEVRPSVAWDGERFLIVWQSGPDIVGATLTPDGQTQKFPLVTAAGSPLVVGISPGRFALAYEVNVDPYHRALAWRYVDFKQRSRPRASR